MSGTDIFLSYARTDRASARIFAEAFAAEGFKVWWDASLHSGETFDEVIEQRLRDAKAVVVLWSPRSVASRWVRAEATQADRRNKLAPAIIEPCDRPIIFELTHAADLCDWTGDTGDIRWQTFVEDLRRLVDAPVEQAPAPQPVHARRADDIAPRVEPPVRQPLRPGSDQVIVPAQPSAAVHRLPLREQPPEEVLGAGEVHCLEIEGSELAPDLFIVEAAGAKVGRTAPADIVLAHRSISREHCIIGLANDELLVSDLNSTNGTFVDDTRVHRATVLPVGSVLKLGQIALRHTIHSREDAEIRSAGGHGGMQAGRLAATS